jgi:hypothetical protein
MTPVSQSELYPWNDSDELLRALGRIADDQARELSEAVSSLLDHDDADIREEALRRLFVGWKDHRRRARAVQALRSDEAPEVRSVAAYAIAATSLDSTWDEDVNQLIAVLEDESEEPAVRSAVYDALLILARNPDFPTKKREFDPRKDVDWDWVNDMRRRRRS